MHIEPTDRPAANLVCPLCGGPNHCAPARCGSFETPCWCTTANFAPELLALVPIADRGLACICADCAAAASTSERPTADTAQSRPANDL